MDPPASIQSIEPAGKVQPTWAVWASVPWLRTRTTPGARPPTSSRNASMTRSGGLG